MAHEETMWEWLIKVGQVPADAKPPVAPILDKEVK